MCLDFLHDASFQWQGALAALSGAMLGAGCAAFAGRYACLLGRLLQLPAINQSSQQAACTPGMACKTGPQQHAIGPQPAHPQPDRAKAPDPLPADADGYSLLVHVLAGRGRHAGLPDPRTAPLLPCGCAVLMALFVFVAQQKYGFGIIFWSMAVAAGMLCVLAIVDAKTALLPDALTLPLLWLGLALAWAGGGISLQDAVGGAMAGYLFLWLLFCLFKYVRGYDGMGYGDFKLFAALGAWAGWSGLPYILLAACVGGILFSCIKQKSAMPAGSYPFGPFLALSGLVTLSLDSGVQSCFG